MPTKHSHVSRYELSLVERGIVHYVTMAKVHRGCAECKKRLDRLVERERKFKDKKARRLKVGFTGEDFDRMRRYREMRREHRRREAHGMGR